MKITFNYQGQKIPIDYDVIRLTNGRKEVVYYQAIYKNEKVRTKDIFKLANKLEKLLDKEWKNK